jgi:thymidylate kinase
VIAFVGSEATGKSTLLEQTRGWLGEHFAVEQIHAGKPRSTPLTFFPNLLVPALRSLFPGSRASKLEARSAELENDLAPRHSFPVFFAIRAALLAFDRRALLLKAFRKAANGTLVLSDRYPSRVNGAPDSPQLALLASKGSMRGWLARLEMRLYRQIPPPDLVIYLKAPLEVTLSRNASRSKTEPEQYVRLRHGRASNLEFEGTRVVEINTDQPFEQTVLEVKQAIWSIL